MTSRLQELDAKQLLRACAIMENAMLYFINKCNRRGIDTVELKQKLDEAHDAVAGLESA